MSKLFKKMLLKIGGKSKMGRKPKVENKEGKEDAPKVDPKEEIYGKLVVPMGTTEFIDAFYNGSVSNFLDDNPEILKETKNKFLKDQLHKDTLLAWAKKKGKISD